MLSIKSLAGTALVGLLPLISASPSIVGLSAPTAAVANTSITATLSTVIPPQRIEEWAIIWGLADTQNGGQNTDGSVDIGSQIGFTQLYGTNLVQLNSFTVDIKIPQFQAAGNYLIVAAIPISGGLVGTTRLHSFTSPITISA